MRQSHWYVSTQVLVSKRTCCALQCWNAMAFSMSPRNMIGQVRVMFEQHRIVPSAGLIWGRLSAVRASDHQGRSKPCRSTKLEMGRWVNYPFVIIECVYARLIGASHTTSCTLQYSFGLNVVNFHSCDDTKLKTWHAWNQGERLCNLCWH